MSTKAEVLAKISNSSTYAGSFVKQFVNEVTCECFTHEEYMTIRGNIICFEDGAKIFFDEWTKGKDYLNDGWSLFSAPKRA